MIISDIVGETFGKLTVLEKIGNNKWGDSTYKCCCECGNITEVVRYRLVDGRTKSCGKCCRKYHKNESTYETVDDVCYITDSYGNETIIDTFMEDEVKLYHWSMNPQGYYYANIKGKRTGLHKFIADFNGLIINDCKYVIDHINGNKQDNRVQNLRPCTMNQNRQNRGCQKNSKTGVKGVSVSGKKYIAQIQKDGVEFRLGSFDTIKEASDAYDLKAFELYGEFAYLNNYSEGELNDNKCN